MRKNDHREERGKRFEQEKDDGFREEVIFINRVAKVVKGGRKFGFSALVAVGDGDGQVGLGIGKAGEVVDAIRKGVDEAKKGLISVPREGTTIPYELKKHYCSTTILMKPAREGTGVIAGGPARVILKLAGITDVSAKFMGSNNQVNCARAAFGALESLRTRKSIIRKRRASKADVKEPVALEPADSNVPEAVIQIETLAGAEE